MHRLKRFLRLPADERGLLSRALLYAAAARACVSLVTFRAICRYVAGSAAPAHAGVRYSPGRIAKAVGAAGRVVPGSTCLSEAMAAHVLLRRSGWTSVLCLSIQPARAGGAPFQAHASVESEGRIVLGGAAGETFAALARIG
jgi:hypothetical protein